jgi:hypothetical protein
MEVDLLRAERNSSSVKNRFDHADNLLAPTARPRSGHAARMPFRTTAGSIASHLRHACLLPQPCRTDPTMDRVPIRRDRDLEALSRIRTRRGRDRTDSNGGPKSTERVRRDRTQQRSSQMFRLDCRATALSVGQSPQVVGGRTR